MKGLLFFTLLGAVAILGCASYEVDTTNYNAMQTSIEKVKTNLTSEEQLQFESALQELIGSDSMSLFADNAPDSVVAIKSLIHKKTAKDIMQAAMQSRILRTRINNEKLLTETGTSTALLQLQKVANIDICSTTTSVNPTIIDVTPAKHINENEGVSIKNDTEIADYITMQMASMGLVLPIMARDEKYVQIDPNFPDYLVDKLPVNDRLRTVVASGTEDYSIAATDFNGDSLKDVFVQVKSGSNFVLYYFNSATNKFEPFEYKLHPSQVSAKLEQSGPFSITLMGSSKEILWCFPGEYNIISLVLCHN